MDARHGSRSAFTLFEIAIALALVAVAVTSALALFPVGLKAQQVTRLRILAAMKAVEMAESFATTHNTNPAIDGEAPLPWDVPSSRCTMAPDLEQRLCSSRFGIMPLPTAIARRLDSDDDAIARHLDAGGLVYYSQPQAAGSLQEQSLSVPPAAESQKLVFAVLGSAQTNAIGILPWKSWPYHVAYPSPPMHGPLRAAYATTSRTTFTLEGGACGCFEEFSDPDIAELFAVYRSYAGYASSADIDAAHAEAYLQAALGFCVAKSVAAAFYAPPSPATPLTDFATPAAGGASPGEQVQAMRFLAHAATCMTRWHDLGDLPYAVPAGAFARKPTPALALTDERVRYYHESCLALVNRFAASFPYDWSVPRPLQRATMMDYPLIEWDLFSAPIAGSITGTSPAVAAAQWHPITPITVAGVGRAASYPDQPIDPSIWGDRAHFTLTHSFQPAERCRQLVFWSVDWQAYEDCETCPSAALDASRYPLAAPVPGRDFLGRMDELEFRDEQLYSFRNPEKTLAFKRDMSGVATGADVRADMILNNWWIVPQPDQGSGDAPGDPRRHRFIGAFGADRNFDQRLDRGPVPRSARMRATLVARFNVYDPRLPMVLH